MTTVTIDTNVLPAEDLLAAGRKQGFIFAVATVTEREVHGTNLAASIVKIRHLPEPGVYGESRYGKAVCASHRDGEMISRILDIISNNSFPRDRKHLTRGQRRQLRDALILAAHIREGYDIFVTDDVKAYVAGDRRRALEHEFRTCIYTSDEFLAFCTGARGDARRSSK